MKLPVIDFDSITQGQLEKYFKAYRRLGGNDEGIGVVESAGAIVRAAVEVGWLEFDVENAKPHDILEINRTIQEYIKEVFQFDPKN